MAINTTHSIQTFTGTFVDPFDPDPDSILIEDIAHALSRQPRFSGHTVKPFSVAQHSLAVANFCPQEDRLWGLLHDGSEALLVDLPRPIKRHPKMAYFGEVEDGIQRAIAKKFGLPWPMPESVKAADNLLLVAEAKRNFHGVDLWLAWPECQNVDSTEAERFIDVLAKLSTTEVEHLFLTTFRTLFENREAA